MYTLYSTNRVQPFCTRSSLETIPCVRHTFKASLPCFSSFLAARHRSCGWCWMTRITRLFRVTRWGMQRPSAPTRRIQRAGTRTAPTPSMSTPRRWRANTPTTVVHRLTPGRSDPTRGLEQGLNWALFLFMQFRWIVLIFTHDPYLSWRRYRKSS